MKNTILFSKIDREDAYVSFGLAFKVKPENTKTYEDAYNEVKDKIETTEIISAVFDKISHLIDDEDTIYKFTKTYWNRGLIFEYVNEDDEYDIIGFNMSADFIYSV